MRVEQAVFTSLRGCRLQGYHLAARSAGIDERLAAELTQWGPSHDSLVDPRVDAASLNFHPLSDGRFVLSRSVRGGPEYSGRGGLQVVTGMLVLRAEQLRAFDGDALVLARIARSAGLLRYVANVPESLPPAELPEATTHRWRAAPPANSRDLEVVTRAAQLLDSGERVALCGAADPETVVARLTARLSSEARGRLSFTTGLAPSLHRSFHLHFLPATDGKAHADRLLSYGIRCLSAL
jgi:hypothetical protein